MRLPPLSENSTNAEESQIPAASATQNNTQAQQTATQDETPTVRQAPITEQPVCSIAGTVAAPTDDTTEGANQTTGGTTPPPPLFSQPTTEPDGTPLVTTTGQIQQHQVTFIGTPTAEDRQQSVISVPTGGVEVQRVLTHTPRVAAGEQQPLIGAPTAAGQGQRTTTIHTTQQQQTFISTPNFPAGVVGMGALTTTPISPQAGVGMRQFTSTPIQLGMGATPIPPPGIMRPPIPPLSTMGTLIGTTPITTIAGLGTPGVQTTQATGGTPGAHHNGSSSMYECRRTNQRGRRRRQRYHPTLNVSLLYKSNIITH